MSKDSSNRPYIGVGVMIWRGDKLLLGRRIHDNGERSWQFPGGHLEYRENVITCAEREVMEETGLKIQNAKQAGFTNDVFTVSGNHYVTLFISAEYASGNAEVREQDKCESWQWFDYNDLPQPLFLPIKHFLQQYPDLKVLRNALDIRAGVHK